MFHYLKYETAEDNDFCIFVIGTGHILNVFLIPIPGNIFGLLARPK